MYTLKIRFLRNQGEAPDKPVELAEKADYFIPADEVVARGDLSGLTWQEEMRHWGSGDYHQLLSVTYYDHGSDPVFMDGRLIEVTINGERAWYLASIAWLLGSDGRTIERLV